MEQEVNKIHLEKCPVCGSKESAIYLRTKDYFLSNEEFDLVQCKNCMLVYTNPIPTPEKLSAYYESNDYLSHKPERKNVMNFIYQSVRNINIRKKYKLVNQYHSLGRVLEVGIGTGELLNYFKQKGWETLGIEPNDYARNYAINNYKLDVYNENKLNEFEENSMNVIMLWHVLEHVSELNERINQLKRLLKKEGNIFIAVPNLDSPDSKKYKDFWAGLDVPRHLYHFTETSLNNIVKQHSLKIIAKYPMKYDAYYVSLLSEKYLGKRFGPVSAIKNGFMSNWQAKKDNNYSSMIFVVSE